MERRVPADILSRARRLKLVLADCDGVLTDGGVYFSERGETLKRFNIRDGMGVERLRDLAGIETGIITGELSPSVVKRAEKLAIHEVHLGCKYKVATVKGILERLELSFDEVAYIGDDVNDLPVFDIVGLTACPSDALEQVRAKADVILGRPGGHGAFREFAEIVLQALTDKA